MTTVAKFGTWTGYMTRVLAMLWFTHVWARLNKSGAVESTLVPDFLQRLNHFYHKQRWYFIGHRDSGIRFVWH